MKIHGPQLFSITVAVAILPTSIIATYFDASVSTCCSLLATTLPNTTFPRDSSNSSVYYTESTAFWSATEWLDPACVFLPTSTADVSTAVSIFNANNCPFSIRGCGHLAFRGAANIDDGILMSMKNIKGVSVSPDKQSAVIGAGLTFAEIYSALENHQLTIGGGRFATVGTGLLLGAGFSYLGNRHGLSVHNVKRHVVVLANGTVVNATVDENSDLHWALKGGSNNFGVVTHFECNAYRTEGIFGGRITYPESSLPAVQDATYNYQVKVAVEDLDVHVLPTYVYDAVSNTTYGFSPIVANSNVTELPPSLKEWTDIPYSKNTLRPAQYSELANEVAAGFPDGLVQSHFTFTTYPNKEFFAEVLSKWRQFSQSYSHIDGFNGLQTVMPITQRAISEGIRKGGDPLGIAKSQSTNQTLSVFYLGLTFNNKSDIDEVFPAWEIFIRTLQALAKESGLLFPYIMTTYSDHSQQVFQSYGADNVEKLQKVQKIYDPTLVFQRLVTGGQKLPL